MNKITDPLIIASVARLFASERDEAPESTGASDDSLDDGSPGSRGRRGR